MPYSKEKDQNWKKKLNRKYRLIVMDDESFEEKTSFRLTRLNVYLVSSTIFLLLVIMVSSLIVFTPLKHYIPGYGDVNVRRQLVEAKIKLDSLEHQATLKNQYINRISNILNGKVDTSTQEVTSIKVDVDTALMENIIEEDSVLRAEVEANQFVSGMVSFDQLNAEEQKSLESINFVKPVNGIITKSFDLENGHLAVDIVSKKNAAISAISKGKVIIADWTIDTGYVIGIQHENDLLSLYKHNSVLLKKVGSFVDAGEAIAIIGNSGELSSGPHLHFELWYKGNSVNPEEYISF